MTRPLPPIILASGSPRRKELLANLGLAFEVVLPLVDEKDLALAEDVSPGKRVEALAHYKGASVAQKHPNALVIAADTIVVLGQQVLEKPVDRSDAFAMLSALQGQTHTVYSAIAVYYQGQHRVESLATQVTMAPLNSGQIEAYIQTHEPMDKAGAYAIQGMGSTLITRIEGCYFNVVGMSLSHLAQLTQQLGVSLVL